MPAEIDPFGRRVDGGHAIGRSLQRRVSASAAFHLLREENDPLHHVTAYLCLGIMIDQKRSIDNGRITQRSDQVQVA